MEHRSDSRRLRDAFDAFASSVARTMGHPSAFMIALLAVVAWAVSGPMFHFSDTWQLVINTGTTVLTFLMVFVIQNTINRDSMALHLKLDELIRVTAQARDALIGSERLSEEKIEELERLETEAREHDQTASAPQPDNQRA